MRIHAPELRGRTRAPAVLLFSALLLCWPRDAHAYLDPATGSMILQAVAASIAAGFFALKVHWRKVKALLTRAPAEAPEPSATASTAASESE